jgi:hypothetical protein
MFKADTSELPSGRHYRILEDGAPLSFRCFFELLAADATFDKGAEFVLIEAPMLANFAPEPAPFAGQFERAQEEEIVVFPNLGGDAVLVVPSPRGPDENYPHLAAFLRRGDKDQVRDLWRRTAQEMLRSVGERPIWLSTAGGGVAWLHMRLDSRPKYYSYAPYRENHR